MAAHFYYRVYMPGKIEEIQGISVQLKDTRSTRDQTSGEERFTIRDTIVERIRRIAGTDSIRRIVPIQSQGDHKTQDISFDMEDVSYLATVRYNNSLTEGWISDLKKEPKKC